MGDKAYIINILQELEGEVKEAKGLLIMLEMGMMSQDNMDAILVLLKGVLKTTQDNTKKRNIEENIAKLENMKNNEKVEEEDTFSLEKLLSNL